MSEQQSAENDAPWGLTAAERVERVPHVTPECDQEGCYCPDDVFWRRLLGDADPCAPGKDWAAAAFGSLDDEGDGGRGHMRRCPWDDCPHGADCVQAVEVDPLAEPSRVIPPEGGE